MDRIDLAADLAAVAAESPADLAALAHRLAAGLPVRHLGVPQEGLALLTMEDGVCGDRFHLGEAALAVAHVEVGGSAGGAAILGATTATAVAAAVCDAVAAGGLPGAEAVHALAARGRAARAERDRRRAQMRAATRVDFAELGESA
ncbi:MAG: phosphonate C-P lyase system protein PhnG [Planctomycetes bacterium]|nr:phosphonate C-P lyase system protein PhnG [Planctomycetota bacterium]